MSEVDEDEEEEVGVVVVVVVRVDVVDEVVVVHDVMEGDEWVVVGDGVVVETELAEVGRSSIESEDLFKLVESSDDATM